MGQSVKSEDAGDRVLQVVGAMNRAGAEVMVMNLLRNRKPEDPMFDFVYFTEARCDFDEEIQRLGGRIHRIVPNRPLVGWRLVRFRFQALIRLLKANPYRVVHAHTLHSIAFWMLAARRAKVPVRIAHAHNTQDGGGQSVLRKIYHKLASRLCTSNATHLLACGQEAGEYLFGRQFEKGLVFPNGIVVDRYHQDNEKAGEQIRQELQLNKDALLITQIGRFFKAKNQIFSLDIIEELKVTGQPFHFLFVGTGPMEEEIKMEVAARSLSDYVSFLGVRQDIPEILAGVDLLLMPSLHEGLPVVLIEAQAAGLPCVLSDGIAKESDLGLGLMHYQSLKDSKVRWVEKILTVAKKPRPKWELRKRKLAVRKYDIANSWETLRDIYKTAGI